MVACKGPEAWFARWRACFHCDDLAEISSGLDAACAGYSETIRTEYGMVELEVADWGGTVVGLGMDTK